ncbi:MAG: 4Fe-4S dicluster domain-containing protein [Fuerstiella sp.]
MTSPIMKPEQHVLTTMEKDGSRNWLFPRLSKGSYWHARRIVGYLLIAIFVALPHLEVNGKPAILLDLVHRKFNLMGMTLLATDTLLFGMFTLSIFLTAFLATALLGRIWCGWGCPQTVYMEFVYRPIERLLMGTAGKGGKPRKAVAGWRHVAMYSLFFGISIGLAHTFLAYFVGTKTLAAWMQTSPFSHPGPFLVMAVTTAAMMFDFAFFREQMCLIACPYGRFQSVLLDRHSLIVTYDERRGESRGKVKNKQRATRQITPTTAVHQIAVSTDVTSVADLLPQLKTSNANDAAQLGDCVDCDACVRTCPTGIDIRDGLQMECLHCTQCIDACDVIMEKLNRPKGLIRYSSQSAIAGHTQKLIRARVIIYPALLLIVLAGLTFTVVTKKSFDVTILRNLGQPYVIAGDGRVENAMRLKLVNRLEQKDQFTVQVLSPDSVQIDFNESVVLQSEESLTVGVLASASRDAFHVGQIDVKLEIQSQLGDRKVVTCKLLGP